MEDKYLGNLLTSCCYTHQRRSLICGLNIKELKKVKPSFPNFGSIKYIYSILWTLNIQPTSRIAYLSYPEPK